MCTLIAKNQSHVRSGHVDRGGKQRFNCDSDQILSAGQYYFHVPHPPSRPSTNQSTVYRYPVYPAFSHWAFPHRNVPQAWYSSDARLDDDADEIPSSDSNSAKSVSAISSAVIARDRCCSLSGYRDLLERAHLCPRSEIDWFQTNGMDQYNNQLELPGDVITDDMANAIALKMDLYKALDQSHFVIVRKRGQWVAHFLRKDIP